MRYFSVLSLLALLLSCSSTPAVEEQTKTDSAAANAPAIVLQPGTLNDLSCSTDPGNAFTVYLPADYDTTKKYPLVIFFDAHAAGRLPVEKYKSLADKWHFVFVGSNTSKNGMDGSETMRIGNALIDEAEKRFHADAAEVYLCGFSGGARVVAGIGGIRGDIKGVICNSAAPQAPLTGKTFIGLAGLGDMNYLELKKFDDLQQNNPSPHELLVFDGKHEWAPVGVMEDALLLSRISGNQNGEQAEMAKALAANIVLQSDSLKKTSCMLAKKILQTGIHACTPFHAADELNKRAAALKKTSCDEAEWTAAELQETRLQQELGAAVMQQDTSWWKTHAASYFETKNQGAEKYMRERLRGYASLMCYSYANQAMRSNNLHAAEKLVAVYSIVDPTNSEWAYMRATLYAKLGLNDAAIPLLEKAVELGFNDRSRLQNDASFAPLAGDPRFQALYANMK